MSYACIGKGVNHEVTDWLIDWLADWGVYLRQVLSSLPSRHWDLPSQTWVLGMQPPPRRHLYCVWHNVKRHMFVVGCRLYIVAGSRWQVVCVCVVMGVMGVMCAMCAMCNGWGCSTHLVAAAVAQQIVLILLLATVGNAIADALNRNAIAIVAREFNVFEAIAGQRWQRWPGWQRWQWWWWWCAV